MSDVPIEMKIANYRSAVSISKESANYSLVSLSVADGAELGEVRAEMMLVLDYSGSMYASGSSGRMHIDEVIDAARAVINALSPNDRLGIVAFDDRPRLVCPLMAGENKQRLLDSLDGLKETGHGGTSMRPALEEAMNEIRRESRDPLATRMVVLTDGQAGDTRQTLDYVATLERQSIAALGFGDFDFNFMNQVCAPSKGLCEEVGGKDPTRVKDVFMSQLKIAQNTVASNLRLQFRPTEYVRLKNSYIVHPITTFVQVQTGRDRLFTMDLPIIERSEGIQVLFDLMHDARDAGRFSAAEVSVLYDLPSLDLHDQEIVDNVVVEYTDDARKICDVNRSVKVAYERGYVEKVRGKYAKAVEDGDTKAANVALDTMRRSSNPQLAKIAADTIRVGSTAEGNKQMELASRRKSKQ